MLFSIHTLKTTLAVSSMLLLTVGCSTTSNQMASQSEAQSEVTTATEKPKAMELYEVHHEGRINVFYDRALYHEFLQLGETSFRLTRIGAGPNGETMVFGITKDDKKKATEVAAVKLYDGDVSVEGDFYAEMRRHGRIYVFSAFADMQPVRQFGHPNFFYSEIGAGPDGETVVFVLNSKTKKKRPEALIAKYMDMQ